MDDTSRYEPIIAELTKLMLKPGERLLVRVRYPATSAELEGMARHLKQALGEDIPFIVINADGVEVSVIQPAEKLF